MAWGGIQRDEIHTTLIKICAAAAQFKHATEHSHNLPHMNSFYAQCTNIISENECSTGLVPHTHTLSNLRTTVTVRETNLPQNSLTAVQDGIWKQ